MYQHNSNCIWFVNPDPRGRGDPEQKEVEKGPKEVWRAQKDQQNQSSVGGAVLAGEASW